MPGGRGNGPQPAPPHRWAQEATVRGPVAGAVARAHAAHAADLHEPASSARTLLGEAALAAVCAQKGAALYGYWMDWRTSNQLDRPLSMGDALRPTGEGLDTSLHSSALALLHALRTHHSMDAVPYLNQARATYPGVISELDAELHLLHPMDEDWNWAKSQYSWKA